jgi:hypothetical protein
MLYLIIIGGLFLSGGAYLMLNGAKLIQEDNILQDKKAHSNVYSPQEDAVS